MTVDTHRHHVHAGARLELHGQYETADLRHRLLLRNRDSFHRVRVVVKCITTHTNTRLLESDYLLEGHARRPLIPAGPSEGCRLGTYLPFIGSWVVVVTSVTKNHLFGI